MTEITYEDVGSKEVVQRDEYHIKGQMLVAYNQCEGSGVKDKIAIPIQRVVIVNE